jgi:putative restriction endonuclease
MKKDIEYYTHCFSSLHTAIIKGVYAPHKPLLLLAIMDMVEQGVIRSSRIVLDDILIAAFKLNVAKYVGRKMQTAPSIGQPFFHMQHEPFWKLVLCEGANKACSGYSVGVLRKQIQYALIDDELFELFQDAAARAHFRKVLLDKYLPQPSPSAEPLPTPVEAKLQESKEEEKPAYITPDDLIIPLVVKEDSVAPVEDYETPYLDENGQLTKIANPHLIELLREDLAIDYPRPASALITVNSFYGDRFRNMSLSLWMKLFNGIDWSATSSAPANVSQDKLLLFNKKVDKSFLKYGFVVVKSACSHLPSIIGTRLGKGEGRDVTILIQGASFTARLHSIGFTSTSRDCFRIMWSGSGIIQHLKHVVEPPANISSFDVYGIVGQSTFELVPSSK